VLPAAKSCGSVGKLGDRERPEGATASNGDVRSSWREEKGGERERRESGEANERLPEPDIISPPPSSCPVIRNPAAPTAHLFMWHFFSHPASLRLSLSPSLSVSLLCRCLFRGHRLCHPLPGTLPSNAFLSFVRDLNDPRVYVREVTLTDFSQIRPNYLSFFGSYKDWYSR
ncbi:hypothetical protein WH47_02242, partial [Habropoda laboriosa]